MEYYEIGQEGGGWSTRGRRRSSCGGGGYYDYDYDVIGCGGGGGEGIMERVVVRLASESAVVVFSRSTCCMCHAVKRLFCGMGVNPTVHELDHHPRGKEIEAALMTILGTSPTTTLPVVFIGGNLLGPMDTVLASHINGSLVPLLKQAGALWL